MTVCIHIGAGKTATTTLQNHLFLAHPQIEYLGRPYRDPRMRDLFNHLASADSIEYDAATCRALFAEVIAPRLAGPKLVLVSDEGLSFNAFHTDRRLIAERLFDLFGPSKIVMTVRNQFSAIESYYVNHARSQKQCPACLGTVTASFHRWLAHSITHASTGYLASLKYFELARTYAEIFGRANVRIILFEDFVNAPARFFDELCGFIGVDAAIAPALVAGRDAKPRIRQRAMTYERLRALLPGEIAFSRFLPAVVVRRFRLFLEGGPAAKVDMSRKELAFIARYYAESNRRLAAEFGLALAAYGYPLPPGKDARQAAGGGPVAVHCSTVG